MRLLDYLFSLSLLLCLFFCVCFINNYQIDEQQVVDTDFDLDGEFQYFLSICTRFKILQISHLTISYREQNKLRVLSLCFQGDSVSVRVVQRNGARAKNAR